MRKVFIAFAALLICGSTFGQKDFLSGVFAKYAGQEGITMINITGDMLKLWANAEQERRDTVFTSKLTDIKVMALQKNCDKPVNIDLITEVYDKLDKSVYKEMINIKQNDEDVHILVREAGNRISEIIVIVGGLKENALIHVQGDMLLSEMADMAGKFQMKGFDFSKNFEKQ